MVANPKKFQPMFLGMIQTGKCVVLAEDLQRARKLACAQRPMKRAEFEKYTWKYPISYGEAMAGVVILCAQIRL